MGMTVKQGGKVSPHCICPMCGMAFGKRTGNFYSMHSPMCKGVRTLPICKQCADTIYEGYLSECENPKAAVRQVCRKLDVYWSAKVFDAVYAKSAVHTVFSAYLAKIANASYSGKCYDDTLKEEGVFWKFERLAEGITLKYEDTGDSANAATQKNTNDDGEIELTKEIVDFWGSGLTPKMYRELEQRKRFWVSQYPDGVVDDIGQLALLRQICNLELEINSDRACGRPVDKNVNALNTLLGSASLKPVQKKTEDDNALLTQPLGVWLDRYENKRPLPEVDETLKDKLKIIKYITVWFKGHLSKMLGIRNSYSQLYEDEMNRLRVDRPEYDGDDDEAVLYDVLNGGDADGEDEI